MCEDEIRKAREEERVRRETVEKVKNSTAQRPNPDQDGCYITNDMLDRIAEGGEK